LFQAKEKIPSGSDQISVQFTHFRMQFFLKAEHR